jgi:hypothetical protein
MLECGELMTKLMGAATFDEYATFGDKCLQLDPVSLAVALDEAVCVACGDGVVSGPPYGAETCDAGALPAMPALFSGA